MARVDGSDDENCVLYGLHAIREALRAGNRPLQRLLVLRTDGQFADLVSLARVKGVPVHVEPRPAIDRMVPRGNHQGVVGIVAAKAYSEEDDVWPSQSHSTTRHCWYFSTEWKIHTISAQCCVHPRRLVYTA